MLCHKIRKLLFIVHHNPYAVGACLCYHCFRILHRTTRQVSGRPGVLCGHVSLWPVLRRIPFTTRARRVTPPLSPEAKEEEQFNSPDPQ